MSQIGTKVTASSMGAVLTLTPDVGGAIGPNGSGTIFVPGGTNITTTGSGNTVTIALTGTVAVAHGGTGDATLTPHGVLIGEGTSPVNVTAAGNNGQVLIGSTGADPAFATLTSTGGTITFTTGAHSLNLETSTVVADSFVTDSGTATPSAGVLTVAGGNNIGTTGSGSTVTINLNDTTNHAVQIGNAGGSLTSLGVGTNGQVLLGATTADPAFATLTSTGGTVTFTTGANSLNLETSTATANSFVTDSGTATPSAGVLTVTGGNNIGTTGSGSTLTVNLNDTTNHAVQIGNASASLTSLGVGTDGQVLIGATTADPAFASLTSSGNTITFSTGANTLNLEATPDTITGNTGGALSPSGHNFNIVGGTNISTAGSGSTLTINLAATIPVSLGGTGDTTLTAHGVLLGEGTSAIAATTAGSNGQVLIGATGADPAFATLTSTGGSITFTTGANSLNLEAASGGGMTWSVVTGASQTLVKSNGYFANNAGTVTFTLPVTAAVGDTFGVSGMNNATGWTIAQNSGQTIHFGTFNTTTGATGSLSSTATYDTIVFVCNIANNDFVVIQSIGNIGVV